MSSAFYLLLLGGKERLSLLGRHEASTYKKWSSTGLEQCFCSGESQLIVDPAKLGLTVSTRSGDLGKGNEYAV